jgi:hypothetical protein
MKNAMNLRLKSGSMKQSARCAALKMLEATRLLFQPEDFKFQPGALC